MRPLALALQNAIQPRRKSYLQDTPPPGAPAANPLGLTPPASAPDQQTPAQAMPTEVMPAETPPQSTTIPMPTDAPRQNNGLSRGQLIMGIIADAIAGAQGRPGQFAQMMGQRRQQENEMAQWQLQRRAGLEDFRERQRIEQEFPEQSPMVRDAQAWSQMDPQQRAAYQQFRQASAGDPDVVVPLSNGQIYAGPRSGLAQALTGGAPPPAAPPRPVGQLTPLEGGAGTEANPATFRPGEFIDPNLRGRW